MLTKFKTLKAEAKRSANSQRIHKNAAKLSEKRDAKRNRKWRERLAVIREASNI